MAATILDLADTVELDLRLMIGKRGVLGASNSATLLIDRVEKAEDVARILEEI